MSVAQNDMTRACFFDMDGVLFDSMPNHAKAWEKVMNAHHFTFSARDCYVNEGRTGQDVIREALEKNGVYDATDEEIWHIYNEKSAEFHRLGGAQPMPGMAEVLADLQEAGAQIWVVTGSGQKTLLDHLNEAFMAKHKATPYFARERMITAYDVTHGKPHPEPYLKAWERSGLGKDECMVVENAPLGVRAGKAAGLFTVAVNTGILTDQDLWKAGADIVMHDMYELRRFIQLKHYIDTNILPLYDTFDLGHNRQHAEKVIAESLNLCRELGMSNDSTLPAGTINDRMINGKMVNVLMVYVAAAMHDVGLQTDREHHHLHSGAFIREDKALRQWFSEEQIATVAEAAEDHRASRKEPPRSIYGCIVAEADRDIDAMTILRRTVQFGMKHYPCLSKQEHLERAYCHLLEKYAEGGYLKLWMHSSRNEQGLAELRSIIHDKQRLMQLCSELYDETAAFLK